MRSTFGLSRLAMAGPAAVAAGAIALSFADDSKVSTPLKVQATGIGDGMKI